MPLSAAPLPDARPNFLRKPQHNHRTDVRIPSIPLGRAVPRKGAAMPVLSTPNTTNTVPAAPNAAEQTRTFPNGSDALDRRGNLKELKKPESAQHTISSNTLKIVSFPVWFRPKKSCRKPEGRPPTAQLPPRERTLIGHSASALQHPLDCAAQRRAHANCSAPCPERMPR